ncbi:hypothetical protein KEM54_005964 [Ascosphaera aggregata]|nr:hypothetical protein KEM54_005964 [Ascosphaera aggregata]
MLASESNTKMPSQPSWPPRKAASDPPEDDLDALLAEEDEVSALRTKNASQKIPDPGDFEDDWEAMNDLMM